MSKTRKPRSMPGKAYTLGVITTAIVGFGVVRFAVAFVRDVRRLNRQAKRLQLKREAAAAGQRGRANPEQFVRREDDRP